MVTPQPSTRAALIRRRHTGGLRAAGPCLGAALALLLLSGCGTYGDDVADALDATRAGDYAAAEEAFAASLDGDGADRLLRHMELGTLAHLQGDYARSNRHLGAAERIAGAQAIRPVADRVDALLKGPRGAAYRPHQFERVYINYFRMLNYTFLAQEALAAGERRRALTRLDSARVEARRIDLALTALVRTEGDYDDLEDRRARLFGRLMRVFEVLRGQWVDTDWLVYRDDAYLRYLTGIVYEMLDEPDNARIAYERAGRLYASGYGEQYALGSAMAGQAWFDATRVMATTPGYPQARVARARANVPDRRRDALARRLAAADAGEARGDIVVLNHVALVPERRELNMRFYVDERGRAFVLEPVPTGERRARRDQFAWFFLMYADTGALNVILNYANGGLYEAATGLLTKRFPLGPAWELAQELRLPATVGPIGLRVAVPYYAPVGGRQPSGEVTVAPAGDGAGDARTVELRNAASPAHMAMQQQLVVADRALRAALARELVRNFTVDAGAGLIRSEAGDGLGLLTELAGRLGAAATARADTRSWLTLPRTIQIARVAVPPGQYDVTVETRDRAGTALGTGTTRLAVRAGDIRLWRHRAMPPADYTPPPPKGRDDGASVTVETAPAAPLPAPMVVPTETDRGGS